MTNSDKVIYLILLIMPVVELVLNYNAKDFPKYHLVRIKFDICCIFLSAIPLLFIIVLLCCPFCLCFYFIFIIFSSLAAFYYAIYSFYLYFAYNGGKRIKSIPIRILLWISFINFLINLFSSCHQARSSSSSSQEEKNSNDIELDEREEPAI